MATNSELLIILFFSAIGFVIYKILERTISNNMLSKISNSLIVIESIYLVFNITTQEVYSPSTLEMIIFGLILSHMLAEGKKNKKIKDS